MNHFTIWSEKAEAFKERIVEEKGVDRNHTKSVKVSLLEIANMQKQGYETFSDWIDALLFPETPAPYRAYSLHYFIAGISANGQQVELVIWAEDNEIN